jgi:hypothetical protein
MKVLCIGKGTPFGTESWRRLADSLMIIGELYTVIDEGIGDVTGEECYEFAEIQIPGYHPCFVKKYFIPLSDIDERHMERNYKIFV